MEKLINKAIIAAALMYASHQRGDTEGVNSQLIDLETLVGKLRDKWEKV